MSEVRNVKRNQGNKKRDFSNWRIYALIFLILFVVLSILVKLYSIQVINYGSYKALADDEHSLFKKLVPSRGEIYLQDNDGLFPAAVNKESQMVYAVPKEISNPTQTAQELADALQLNESDLVKQLSKPNDTYEPIEHKLSDAEVQKIQDLKLKGVYLAPEVYRYYPSDELAANVLGFLGWKENTLAGRYGIEASFENELKGKPGTVLQDLTTSGNWAAVGKQEITQATDGDSLVLTIDRNVQYEAENLLKSAIEKYQADSGSAVVMDPKTGKVLAMADYPTFNPNDYSQVSNMSDYINSTVSDAYEPGSIFKAITMAAGLDSGKITPDTTYTDTGAVHIDGYTIKNALLKAYGVQTMTQVLELSLNTGAIFAEQQIGNQNFLNYVKRFGFGAKTGIDLPGESAGNLSNLDNVNSKIDYYTASFGQGITITPIQLVTAYSAIANGGELMKPQIVDKIIHPDGSAETIQPQPVRRVISEKAAQEAAQMLRAVVTKGDGGLADVPGYQVVGKTGTAQVASTDSRGYANGITIGSFAGFAPMNNPKFVVLVEIVNPKAIEWAEFSAAPTFGELMKFLLDYYNVPPTEKYTAADMVRFDQEHDLQDYFLQNQNSDGTGGTSNGGTGAVSINSNNNNESGKANN